MDRGLIATHAARHHGVLSPAMLDKHGVSARQRRLRVANGEWRRLPNGILVIPGAPETFEMWATAALLAVPGSVLSHQSAGQIAGMGISDQRLHLSIERGGTTKSAGSVVHRSILEPCDVTRRGGFRVTTVERTLVDLGASLGLTELQRIIEEQLVAQTTTFDRLERTFTRLVRPGRTGIARTRSVLATLDGNPPNESELEARFVRLLGRRGLPVPTRQASFDWMTCERGRVDAYFPAHRLIVELDGRRFHARLAAFETDRRRDQNALVNGHTTVRFTYRQISDEPGWVVDVMRSLLSSGGNRCPM